MGVEKVGRIGYVRIIADYAVAKEPRTQTARYDDRS
jgi:hypothetical protein